MTAGKTSVAEMNETSMATKLIPGGRSPGPRLRALVRSMRTTRGIAAQAVGDLSVTGVNAENAVSPVLEHAVGESSGGGSDVEAEPAGEVDVPVMQGGFELEATAANVAEVAAQQT